MILTCSVGTFPLTGEPNPFASINSVLKINFYPFRSLWKKTQCQTTILPKAKYLKLSQSGSASDSCCIALKTNEVVKTKATTTNTK